MARALRADRIDESLTPGAATHRAGGSARSDRRLKRRGTARWPRRFVNARCRG
ncbi:hypothetical protein BURPS1106B_1302 [Burkholderia pseudomallei 1106b]|uniref:Uncharacterized protein n=1 Tax=Burkholderia pseudomallei 1710a TaxID=320371 RepID=A0A0E1VVU5_BURPE|nr:hypothetical protein BURPS668_A0786 [Burkholderia pseudomallei 668]EEH27365.1 conserved hypothetical protein [Burkholderia pseudomallei Pakistan 9]EEP51795.1 conserved hypothetical protein [Burkholderia pseudomallei MSHR346]EES22171.1 hypothetical protein BURPS1106B_1302 [Burkholderia pseudomallei 1106b]EET05055.1 hypothetical protein BURPS1710A_A3199 [Burkholderia pseudomallei 1710a]